MALKNDRIAITKENIPYRFSIALPKTVYELEIRYNETADLFTVALYKGGKMICVEPTLYGTVLFSYLYKPETFPMLKIVPQDSSGSETRVTWENFGETVFLEIENSGD